MEANAEIKTYSAVFDSHRSIESGCLIVKKNMRKAMIENQCGTNLQGGGLRFKSSFNDSLVKIHLETSNGYVTKWRVMSDAIKASQDGKNIECSVKAQIEVTCNSGKRSPDFAPFNASLNQSVFFEGNDMKLSINSTPHDRYLTIVQLITRPSGKQEVWRIFPNLFQPEQLLKAGVDALIPNGYRLTAKTIPEQNVILPFLTLVKNRISVV